jgi:predicted RNase H-like HicB family nuclease
MNEQNLIDAVRNHALANYNIEGWDYLVECWMDGDILECLDGAETVEQAIANVREALAPLAERRDEVRAAGGEW